MGLWAARPPSVEHTLLLDYLNTFLILDLTPAAIDVAQVVDALAFQQGCRYDAAIAAAAVDVQVMPFFDLCHVSGVGKFLQRDVECVLDVSVCELRFPSDVEYDQVLIEGDVHREFVGFYVDDHIDGFTGLPPCLESARQIAFDLVESHAGEADDAFLFFSGRGDEHDRFVEGQDAAGPFREAAVEADTDGAGHEAGDKMIRMAGIEEDGVAGDPVPEGGEVQRLEPGLQYLVEAVISFLVNAGVDRKVLGGGL